MKFQVLDILDRTPPSPSPPTMTTTGAIMPASTPAENRLPVPVEAGEQTPTERQEA
ncbi:hypothetical protein [Arthrobacter sp. B10-11]|uniref:hypothetical protein n=1 Tax=Arthrobacter sp. B10-11 TaxID=3081160 RepID=UPI0029558161|nr:hypothetical protein [Arthrobacter sp. B10-11]